MTGLAAIGFVTRVRDMPAKTLDGKWEISRQPAYYLLSTALTAERFGEVVRSHWAVENGLHWRLDVVMNEDQQRNRSDNGPHNLAVSRHMALNVMQKDTTKDSLRGRIKRAALRARVDGPSDAREKLRSPAPGSTDCHLIQRLHRGANTPGEYRLMPGGRHARHRDPYRPGYLAAQSRPKPRGGSIA